MVLKKRRSHCQPRTDGAARSTNRQLLNRAGRRPVRAAARAGSRRLRRAAPSARKGGNWPVACGTAGGWVFQEQQPAGDDSVAGPIPPRSRDPCAAAAAKCARLIAVGRGRERSPTVTKIKRREPRINVKMASLPEVAEPAPCKIASTWQKPKSSKARRQTQSRCHCRSSPRVMKAPLGATERRYRRQKRTAHGSKRKRRAQRIYAGEKSGEAW